MAKKRKKCKALYAAGETFGNTVCKHCGEPCYQPLHGPGRHTTGKETQRTTTHRRSNVWLSPYNARKLGIYKDE